MQNHKLEEAAPLHMQSSCFHYEPADESGTTSEDASECSAEGRGMVIFTQTHHRTSKPNKLLTAFQAVFHMISIPHMPCTQLAMLPGRMHSLTLSNNRRVTGTLFGHRSCCVRFCIQEDLKSHPLFLLELGTHTHSLVKEMASGLVRIALECERARNRDSLYSEQVWTMYCNGKKRGNAVKRACSATDLHLLGLLQAVSMGAGVLPLQDAGPDCELMYMRARFERVVGSKDSEAFYMMNPDGKGGPELSIFLLRI